MSAWEMYIGATWVPGGQVRNTLAWELERLVLGQGAIELDPFLGQAHSVLADALGCLVSMDRPSDTPQYRRDAAFHARRTLDFSHYDTDAIFNIGLYHWHTGNLEEATRAMRRVFELDSNHVMVRLLAEVSPYSCAAASDAVLERAIALDRRLPANSPARWVTLNWIGKLHINRGEFDRALEAERDSLRQFKTPDSSLHYAAVPNREGRIREALDVFAAQRQS